MSRGITRIALMAVGLVAAGCAGGLGGGVDATYGRARGASVNGAGVLAELFRQRGHGVRVARRLNEKVEEEADVIVRFAPFPGPPDREEALWYQEWADRDPDRRLIYVPRDFDAEAEYWAGALEKLPAGADAQEKARMEQRQQDVAREWVTDLPPPAKTPADPEQWFETEASPGSPAICRTLGGDGDWHEGLDAGAAKLTRHQVFRGEAVASGTVWLSGDDQPLVVERNWIGSGSALFVANGSFLLNEPLVNPARRPLARRVVEWAGDGPRRVVFVEGSDVLTEGEVRPPRWPPPLDWIVPHLLAFGLVACLSRAVVLGRRRPEPPSGVDRPVAHAEALGELLARTRDAAAARSLLEAYRRWRHPTTHLGAPRGPRH